MPYTDQGVISDPGSGMGSAREATVLFYFSGAGSRPQRTSPRPPRERGDDGHRGEPYGSG